MARSNSKDIRRPEDWFPPVNYNKPSLEDMDAAIAAAIAATFPIAESAVTGLVADLAAKVASTRAINTTAPITGGGDLSADRTLALSGTKAQFNTACSDGDFLYIGDITQYTDEMARDALGVALVAGTNITITVNDSADTITIDATGGSSYTDENAQDAIGLMIDSTLNYVDATPLLQRAALTGDVTAPAGSNATTIAADVVTYSKIQNISATDKVLGRSSSGSGDVEEIICTAAGRALIDDADAAAQRTTLGLLRLIAFFFTTTPTASEVLGIYIAADAFTLAANLSGSQVSIGTNPAATFAVDVQKNGSTIATISISTGGVVTLTTVSGTSKAIAVGDILKFVAPTPADASIANVAVNLKGTL